MGSRHRHEVTKRPELEGFRRCQRYHDDRDSRDRQQVALRIIGQLVVRIRMGGKGGGRDEQQRVVVVGGDEDVDRDDAVAAGTILDHDRLAPARGKTFREHPGGDIDSGAGTERQDEPHCTLRIALRRGRREAVQGG
jgi:hypothetical protein